ncbi:MAG: hypothetical protein QM709_07120 [Spongiibacteraceae bacterium]
MNEHGGNLHNGESNLRSELNASDAELAQRIAKTLDSSTDSFDAETRAQLAMIRHRALASTRKKRIAGAVALAASVLAVIATPWMLRQQAQEKHTEDLAYLSVEPEMLADMDMLLAIGEAGMSESTIGEAQ